MYRFNFTIPSESKESSWSWIVLKRDDSLALSKGTSAVCDCCEAIMLKLLHEVNRMVLRKSEINTSQEVCIPCFPKSFAVHTSQSEKAKTNQESNEIIQFSANQKLFYVFPYHIRKHYHSKSEIIYAGIAFAHSLQQLKAIHMERWWLIAISKTQIKMFKRNNL